MRAGSFWYLSSNVSGHLNLAFERTLLDEFVDGATLAVERESLSRESTDNRNYLLEPPADTHIRARRDEHFEPLCEYKVRSRAFRMRQESSNVEIYKTFTF